jgi:hypothetical protein
MEKKRVYFVIVILAVLVGALLLLTSNSDEKGPGQTAASTPTVDIGQKWIVTKPVKPYNCGLGLHAACDTCRELNIILTTGTVLYRVKDARTESLDCEQGFLLGFHTQGVPELEIPELEWVYVYLPAGTVKFGE